MTDEKELLLVVQSACWRYTLQILNTERCKLPDKFAKNECLVLNMGHGLRPYIETDIVDDGMWATLSFDGRPYRAFLAM